MGKIKALGAAAAAAACLVSSDCRVRAEDLGREIPSPVPGEGGERSEPGEGSVHDSFLGETPSPAALRASTSPTRGEVKEIRGEVKEPTR